MVPADGVEARSAVLLMVDEVEGRADFFAISRDAVMDVRWVVDDDG